MASLYEASCGYSSNYKELHSTTYSHKDFYSGCACASCLSVSQRDSLALSTEITVAAFDSTLTRSSECLLKLRYISPYFLRVFNVW